MKAYHKNPEALSRLTPDQYLKDNVHGCKAHNEHHHGAEQAMAAAPTAPPTARRIHLIRRRSWGAEGGRECHWPPNTRVDSHGLA